MGRRVERRARRRGLRLTHPAEGIALSVAGALVIATLWSSYQNVEQSSVIINPTATSQPTSSEPLGRQDAASYPSALLHPSAEPSSVGQGVRTKPKEQKKPAVSVPSTSSEPAPTPSPAPTPEPSPESSSTTKAPATTPAPPPVDPPAKTPAPPTSPDPGPTGSTAPPPVDPPVDPPDETPDPGTSSSSSPGPSVTGSPSVPGANGGSTSKAPTTPTGAADQD